MDNLTKLTKEQAQTTIQTLLLAGEWNIAAKLASPEEFTFAIQNVTTLDKKAGETLQTLLNLDIPSEIATASLPVAKPEKKKVHWTKNPKFAAKLRAAHVKASATMKKK